MASARIITEVSSRQTKGRNTVIRTPNGGDYGIDLLRQHHDRYDHSHGRHEPRP